MVGLYPSNSKSRPVHGFFRNPYLPLGNGQANAYSKICLQCSSIERRTFGRNISYSYTAIVCGITFHILVRRIIRYIVSRQTHSAYTVSYTHLRAHETPEHLVCRLLLEKKK